MRFDLFSVVQGASNGGKALQPGDDHIVGAAGTVDDEQIAVFISASHNANMGVPWIEYQITRLGLLPGDGGAIGVLGVGPSAVADDIFAAGDVVENPVHK